MSQNPPALTFYSPGVQCLMPLFYVAWSDRMLSPSEVRFLQEKVRELDFLAPEEQAIIQQWSDPTRPPSRELFKHWEIELRQAAKQLPDEGRNSLVDLGLAMVRQNGSLETEAHYLSPKVRETLETLEESLGAIQIDTYRSIFPAKDKYQQRLKERYRASFDTTTMARLLEANYHEVRDNIKELLQQPDFAYADLRQKEPYREQVLRWVKALAEEGFGALAFPEAYGGENDMGKYAAVFETLGYHDLSMTIKFGVQFGLFGGSVHALGTKKHHDKYLNDIGTLDLPGCFAMTETGHGSNVRGLETTATYDPATEEFIIHSPNEEAGKEYIGNALHGHMASVFCQLIVKGKNHGVHALLVPLRDAEGKTLPGVRVEDNGYKLGLNGVDNGRIWFDHVRVPRENLLNRFGDVSKDGTYNSPIENPSRRFFTMLGTLVGGRVCVPRAGLSATKKGLTIAIRYALKRRQFGPNFIEPETLLLDYPSHQRRLMPLLAKAYALNFGLNYLTDRFLNRTEADIREIETLAAGMKAYSTWFTTETLQECREACGGKGYLTENRFADLKADTDIFTTFEGDNTVLMQLVAKGVLSAFRKEFNEEGTMGVLRFIGERVTTSIFEKNPIAIRRTSEEHLLANDFHLNAFRYREQRLTFSVSQRIRGLIKSGINAYDATLQAQTHLLALAEAYIERIVLEQFVQRVENTADPQLRRPLQDLCNLYALHTLEQHKGWYLEQGYMDGVKTKAIRRTIDDLCVTIRQDARGLVDAFDIPDALLEAAILA